ncbi:MAG: exo-alpha-sialidase [Nitrospirae bacterium]|nr:exo-alpha-sialidase [Nitrospirota bacterium]
MTSKPVIKTIIPQMGNTYSSFPSVVEYNNYLYFYYRQGVKDSYQCHGLNGKVRCLRIEKACLLGRFRDDDDSRPQLEMGEDFCVFDGENELDAIVCRLESELFTLCSRVYVRDTFAATYISFSRLPMFDSRHEVVVKGVDWVVFYGKPFRWVSGYVFSAYGVLKGGTDSIPLVLYTEDFTSWSVMSYVKSIHKNVILNENSIVYDGSRYIMFIRQDSAPYGIWYCVSGDLQGWSEPVKLISSAVAPMAIVKDGRCLLSFRYLYNNDHSAISIISPFEEVKMDNIETYEGSPFDGGYTDLTFIDDCLFVLYYVGNVNGEPYIRLAKVSI